MELLGRKSAYPEVLLVEFALVGGWRKRLWVWFSLVGGWRNWMLVEVPLMWDGMTPA